MMATEESKDNKVRNVVIAMDGSEHADYALDWFTKYMHQPRDHVVVIHIPEVYHILHHKSANAALVGPEVLSAMAHKEHDKIQVELEKLAAKLKEHSLGGKVKSVMASKPAEGILKAAQEENADLLVLGSRGKGLVRRTILGSVTDYVLHHSHIPTVVCKHPHWHHHHHHHNDQSKQRHHSGEPHHH